MAGVDGVKSNPYLAKLLGIFSRASDPADQAAQTNDQSSFLQELESHHNPSSQLTPFRPPPIGVRTNREPGQLKNLRPNMDTVEISEEAYEAFRQMQKNTTGDASQS